MVSIKEENSLLKIFKSEIKLSYITINPHNIEKLY